MVAIPGAVRAAETVRKLTLGQVTVGSSVRVLPYNNVHE